MTHTAIDTPARRVEEFLTALGPTITSIDFAHTSVQVSDLTELVAQSRSLDGLLTLLREDGADQPCSSHAEPQESCTTCVLAGVIRTW